MQSPANEAKLYREPGAVDGNPLPGEGWVLDRPTSDPELFCSGVKVVRLEDGQVLKFYLMRVKPEVVKKKRKKLKRKLKQLDEAIDRLNRTELRTMLRLMGKS